MLSPSNDERKSKFLTLKNDLKLIENKIFLGRYTEKCYVESLQTYRDIVVIESSEDIVENLWKTKKALENYAKNEWIGITNDIQNSESNDCLLWVILNNVPIGKHWFQMKAISFEAREIMLEIKHVQPYQSPDRTFTSIDSDFPSIQEIFTYANICEAFKFSTIVVITIFTFIVEASKFLTHYIIELGYLVLNFIHVSSPIWLGLFEFMTKCVFGLYWLIYVMWRQPSNASMPNALVQQNNRNKSTPRFTPSRPLSITPRRSPNEYLSNYKNMY